MTDNHIITKLVNPINAQSKHHSVKLLVAIFEEWVYTSFNTNGASKMKEKDILHECGNYWVCVSVNKCAYQVMKSGITHSQSIASFQLNEDGLSLAKAYCDYKGNKS